MKADRRWWNDGRLERELDAAGRVGLPPPTGLDGQPLPDCHWWEACTTWMVPELFLKTIPTMYKVKL